MHGYRSIFETLRREVLGGKYDATKVLPSEWTLSRRFGVCRPTVSRAVLEMEREGFVVRRQGASTMLTRFAKNASGTIGIVVQGEWNYEDLYPSILRKLMSTAERSGWQVVRCDIEPSRGRARVKAIREIVERLTREHVTGVFLQPMECMRESARFNAEIVARLKTANIHTVLLDYDIVQLPLRSDCDLVGVDNFAAGYMRLGGTCLNVVQGVSHFTSGGLRRHQWRTGYEEWQRHCRKQGWAGGCQRT